MLKALLDGYPDLLAVMLVPVFALEAPGLATAVMVGQNGPVRDPVEVIRMIQTTLAALKHQLALANDILVTVDNHMKSQAEQLTSLTAAIDAKQRELAALEQQKASYAQQTHQPPASTS